MVQAGSGGVDAPKKSTKNSSWKNWTRLDFDGFATGTQYFGLAQYVTDQQLRVLDDEPTGLPNGNRLKTHTPANDSR